MFFVSLLCARLNWLPDQRPPYQLLSTCKSTASYRIVFVFVRNYLFFLILFLFSKHLLSLLFGSSINILIIFMFTVVKELSVFFKFLFFTEITLVVLDIKTSTSVGTDLYPHMPILRPHAARYSTNVASLSDESESAAHADSSDFGLLGEQSSPKCVIPCLGRRRTAVQNLMPLALSLAEKSVTVQTHTHTHKTQTNSKPYIHTLPIGITSIHSQQSSSTSLVVTQTKRLTRDQAA